jgi:hypothetical protein
MIRTSDSRSWSGSILIATAMYSLLRALGTHNQIRVYASDGSLLRRIGRRGGGGPGEFENPPRYGLKGDTLWTYDSPSGRITLFDRAGRVLITGRTQGLQVVVRTGYGYITPVAMRADGFLVGWFTHIVYSRDHPPPAPSADSAVPRVLFEASGTVIDTIGGTPSPPPRMVPPEGYSEGRFRRIRIGSESYAVPDPPTALPQWLPLDDGYVVVHTSYATAAESGTFTVTRPGLTGDTIYHRVLSYRPQPYTDELLDSAAAHQPRAFMDGVEVTKQVDQAIRNKLRAEMDFPDYRLPVDYAWVADDKAVWLRREVNPGQLARWILLSPNGRPNGELELPANARVLWSRADLLWAAVPDEFDVPWLVRYRITG